MAKKIIFMGTPMFSVPILKSLYQNGFPIELCIPNHLKNLIEVKKLINHQFRVYQKL